MEPPMITKMTMVMLTKVKMFVKMADERTPRAKSTVDQKNDIKDH